MKVLIAGGTGMIGRALTESLVTDGHEVIILSRNPGKVSDTMTGVRFAKWDGKTSSGWIDLAENADAIINLAGTNLSAGLWTKGQKNAILSSRVDSGKAITEAVERVKQKPSVVIQASGVGFYGIKDHNLLTEDSPSGGDFLAGVSREWEASTFAVEALGVRRVIIRSGVVFDSHRGALSRLLLPFRLFIGGPLGNGRQWMSWIHIQDEVRAIRFLLENQMAKGVFNLSASPVTNAEFARTTARLMKRPGFISVPAFLLRLVLGEMSTVILDGQRVSSTKITELGFRFNYPDLESALQNLIVQK